MGCASTRGGILAPPHTSHPTGHIGPTAGRVPGVLVLAGQKPTPRSASKPAWGIVAGGRAHSGPAGIGHPASASPPWRCRRGHQTENSTNASFAHARGRAVCVPASGIDGHMYGLLPSVYSMQLRSVLLVLSSHVAVPCRDLNITGNMLPTPVLSTARQCTVLVHIVHSLFHMRGLRIR